MWSTADIEAMSVIGNAPGDDGIIFNQESNDTIDGNTLSNVYDAGIEGVWDVTQHDDLEQRDRERRDGRLSVPTTARRGTTTRLPGTVSSPASVRS